MQVSNDSITKQASVIVEGLSKTFHEQKILDRISFEVHAGESLAIIGPSGVGKSTLLKIIAGLETADEGEVKIRDHKIGMAFQYSALLNSYTIHENIAFALHDSELSQSEKDKLVEEKLQLVGLESYGSALPDELSGGQAKRASFARAIVHDPGLLLYDEPTAGLDPINSTIIEDYINKLSKLPDKTSIIVTHQLSTILRTASRIICLFKGGIVWEGDVKALESDDNPYIRQFIDGKTSGPFTE